MGDFTRFLGFLCLALRLGTGLCACNKPVDLPTLPSAVVAAAAPAATGIPAVSAPAPTGAPPTIGRAMAGQFAAEQAAYASAYKSAALANKLLGAHVYRVAATDKVT